MSGSRCLIISCWTGPRRVQDPRAVKDPLFYIKLQLQQVAKVKHSCDRILFVWNSDTAGPGLLRELPGKASYLYLALNRKNCGMSYGAWSDGVAAFPDYYYYFFLEDDYCFTYDHWDDVLVDRLNSLPFGTYVAGYVEDPPTGKYALHPNISIGAANGGFLRRAGPLPFAKSNQYQACEEKGQVAWGRYFNELSSLHDKWQIPYVGSDNSIKWFGPPDARALWMPAQCLTLEEDR